MRNRAAIELLKFFYVQRVRGFVVPDKPFFENEATTEWFVETLRNSKAYLEFGSGGSTYLAARLGKPFVTVDSDPYFLKAVKQKIAKDNLLDANIQRYCHADIGITREWGFPLFGKMGGAGRRARYSHYSDFRIVEKDYIPDFILIDGRFRAACALKAISALADSENWTIAVDDYLSRDRYKIIETFAKLDRLVGRMAVFTKRHASDANKLAEAISECEYNTS